MFLTFEAVQDRLDREHNERAWLVWHMAVLPRQKRIPPLKKLQIQPRRKKRQTPAEQKAALRAIAASFGGLKPRHG